jgi:hypothetical protein
VYLSLHNRQLHYFLQIFVFSNSDGFIILEYLVDACRVCHTGADGEEDMLGVQTRRRGTATDSLAAKVSRVLREAWLHVLQTHPSTLPCASVLCYDDAPAVKRALHPRTSADMHAVLSNPIPWITSIQKGVPL